jgi:hypothetical protein
MLTHRCTFLVIALGLGSFAPLGCGGPHAEAGLAPSQAKGELQLALVTSQRGSFRLRQAVIQLQSRSGATAVRLESDAEPEATSLRAELAQGAYGATLEDGWSLERLGDDGSPVGIRAALLTPNPVEFEIRDGRVTRLTYEFATDDGIVRFGAGALELTVAVSEPPSSSCDLLDPALCPAEQTCLVADATGATFCAEPGSLPVGAPCSAEQCVRGAQCLVLDPTADDSALCMQFCQPHQLRFGCECQSLSFDASVGVCVPPPFSTCDPLTQTGCVEAETCQHVAGNFATCGTPGTAQVGEACLGETCAAGLDCFGDRPELGVSGSCRHFCDTGNGICPRSFWPFFETCSDVGTGHLGRCF